VKCRGKVGEESGERTGGAGNGNARKISPKRNKFGIWGRALGATAPCHTFLPRDATHKRSLCRHAVSVRLSVCVSVMFVDHVKTNKDIFEIFSPSGSHTILVFPCQTA